MLDDNTRSFLSPYTTHKPRWKQAIAADGRKDGRAKADEHVEIAMVLTDEDAIKTEAGVGFSAWHFAHTMQYGFMGSKLEFDYDGLRNIYTHNFILSYKDRVTNPVTSSAQGGATARIVRRQTLNNSQTYLLEITDPEHLTEPIQVEVVVESEGHIQLREANNY